MLYENIKALSEKKKVSVSQVERECGLKPNSIYHWDENKPSYDKVLVVAKYFETTVEKLVNG